MAFKFGSALRSALYVERDEMQLVQLGPERVFRTESCVHEVEFWKTLELYDVSYPGKLVFVELGESQVLSDS